MSVNKFRDMDGTVVITVAGLPIGKLVKGEVVYIGEDYLEIHALDNKESWFVYKPEQVLYLYTK